MIINSIFAARQTSDSRDPEERRFPYSGRTLAGVTITPDNALSVPAVWGCVKYITESLACMPWHAMVRVERGSEIAAKTSVNWLLSAEASEEWTSFQFVESMTAWALLWGNGFAEIERSTIGAVGLHPIEPWRVSICRRKDTQQLFYEVDSDTGNRTEIEAKDMFHLRGLGNGPVGISAVECLAQTIGWAKAAQLFGAAFFGNGMMLGGVFQQSGKLDAVALARFQQEVAAKHRGPWKSWKPFYAPIGIEWKDTSVPPDKGQFIETAQFLIADICRIFSVPPHIVAELSRSTNNNIEHQGIEAVTRCLLPWVRRLELEANRKLFGRNRPGYFTKMNMSALLRGDAEGRAALYKALFDMGAMSPNEIRELEDMNKLGAEGDKHLVQLALTTLEKAGEQPEAPEAAPRRRDNVDSGLDEDDPMAVAAIARVAALLESAHA